MPVYHFNIGLVPIELRMKWIDMKCPPEAENAHDAHGISWDATRTDTGFEFSGGYIDEPDYSSLAQAIPEIKEMCELDLDMRTWQEEREESLDIELDLLIDAGREDLKRLASLGWVMAGCKSVRQILDRIEPPTVNQIRAAHGFAPLEGPKAQRMPADWAPNEG